MKNFNFNKLDLDLIKYYCGHFNGCDKAIKFITEFNLKIKHLVTPEVCDLSVFDFDYTHFNFDPNNGIERYIPNNNKPEFEAILKNLYIKYIIDNEFFSSKRGFNADQMLLRGSFEIFFFKKIIKNTFIYELLNLEFKDIEMKKKFLFNMLMFCMKDFDLKSEKNIDYDIFCISLGERISKYCLDLNFKISKIKYDIEKGLNNEILKKYYKIDTENIDLIKHINDHILYQELKLEIFLEEKLNNSYNFIGKTIIDFLILEHRFELKLNNLSTKLNIILDKNNESDLFDFNLPSFYEKRNNNENFRVNKKELFKMLKSLDKLRVNPDAEIIDKFFLGKMAELKKIFYNFGEKKNFNKLLRYCCDFKDKNWFVYDPIESPQLYLLYSRDLPILGMDYYITKLVFNNSLFKTIILLHMSNFFLRKIDLVSYSYLVKINKSRSKN